jgi:hypothetical protein
MEAVTLIVVIVAFVLLDVLAVRFGHDSRDYKRAVWW